MVAASFMPATIGIFARTGCPLCPWCTRERSGRLPAFDRVPEREQPAHPRDTERHAAQHISRIMDAEHEAAEADSEHGECERDRTEHFEAAPRRATPKEEAKCERQASRAERVP